MKNLVIILFAGLGLMHLYISLFRSSAYEGLPVLSFIIGACYLIFAWVVYYTNKISPNKE